ncbi:MAG: flagellar hook capping protein [Gammaproteobacteria bacterium HGW-Gammaproteobacteria-6]|jgi:flagellar basal-body rod modification protein FlgD|nr:MAG: flagellar hook capping protein [Gammaproteobacteria bacterium HGW-Gammaproteobacteria-6]
MNDLSAISNSLNASISGQTAASLAGNRDALGQEDFLKLMITQFRNQDPTQPTDSTQFLGQLAQFSTVSGIQGLQDSFGGLASTLQGDQALRAAGLIGRQVMFSSPLLGFDGEAATIGAVDNPVSGGKVTVQIADLNGRLLRTVELGQQPAGMVGFSWDGRANDGSVLAPGSYVMSAQVISGSDVRAAETFTQAAVLGVSLAAGSGQPMLRVEGAGEMALSQIREIF